MGHLKVGLGEARVVAFLRSRVLAFLFEAAVNNILCRQQLFLRNGSGTMQMEMYAV